MKAATLKEIRTELSMLHPELLVKMCVSLAKYKKENKELLSYLLFDSNDEENYVAQVKELIDLEFKTLNKSSFFLAKKTVRKVLRITNKFIKYSNSKQTEVELLIYFCRKLRRSGLPLNVNTTLGSIYLRQFTKIKKVIASLHEDLQLDYLDELNLLQ